MAKAKKPSTTTDTDTTVPLDPTAPLSIKVQGMIFSYAPRYFEGHVLSAAEASVLNQTLGENLRNNFATKIRTKLEEFEEEAKKTGEAPRTFTQEEKDTFASEFAAYAAVYTFKGPRLGAGPMDPVEREAHKIATALVRAKLAEKSVKISSLPEGKMAEYVKGALARRTDIWDEARRRVESLQSASDDLFEI